MQEVPPGARHSKPHAQALEISARQRYVMQQHGQGVFVRAPEPQPFSGWISTTLRGLESRVWKVRQTVVKWYQSACAHGVSVSVLPSLCVFVYVG
jgi:hypothetical protein